MTQTREELNRELGHWRSRAQAERHLALIAPNDQNPWAGSTARVEKIESKLADLEERSAAEVFMAAFRRYRDLLRADSGDLRLQLTEVESKIRQVQADCTQSVPPANTTGIESALRDIQTDRNSEGLRALLLRWDGLAHNHLWATYARTLETKHRRDPESPISLAGGFPFTPAEVERIMRFKRLDAERYVLGAQINQIQDELRTLRTAYPALCDVTLLPTEQAKADLIHA